MVGISSDLPIIILGFAFVAFKLQYSETDITYNYTGWLISAIFIIRAIGDFNAVGFFKKIKQTEFANYDTKYFSPLCLSLGAVFIMLSS